MAAAPIWSGTDQSPGHALPDPTRPASTGFASTYAIFATTSPEDRSVTAL